MRLPQRHVVVFDVNVYLDIARLLGPPFRWEDFERTSAQKFRSPPPSPSAADSLRAIAMCTSGFFAGDDPVEVWTNAHIEGLVRRKAQESRSGSKSGLGWTAADAQTLVDDLIEGLLRRSNGGTLGANFPDGNPPLDHEDGMVFGACRQLSGNDPVAHVYCVTRDQSFLDCAREGRLSSHSRVLTPAALAAAMRAARNARSIGKMRPTR